MGACVRECVHVRVRVCMCVFACVCVHVCLCHLHGIDALSELTRLDTLRVELASCLFQLLVLQFFLIIDLCGPILNVALVLSDFGQICVAHPELFLSEPKLGGRFLHLSVLLRQFLEHRFELPYTQRCMVQGV